MPDKKVSYELIPPEGDKHVGERVFQVLAAVLADKQTLGLHDLWKKNYRLRRNKHWKTDSASIPLISVNLIFTHTQRNINTLTDNNPIFNVICKSAGNEDGMKAQAQDIQRAADDWWADNEQQTKLESSVTNGEFCGICIEEIAFNADLAGGLGDVETRIVDPMNFGWYPVKMADLQDLQKKEAVVEFYVESCRVLRQKYPKLADKIKPDTDILEELNDDRREINSQSDKSSRGNNLLLVVQNVVRAVGKLFKSATISDIDNEETVVCKCWVRDRSETNDGDPAEDEEGNVVQRTKQKYTGGIRYILACSGGQVVLEDKDNPNINPNIPEELARQTYLYDKFPYIAANSIIDPVNAWGITDLEDIDKLNMELNKALSQMVLEKDQGARKKLCNPLDSGVENHQLTSYPSIYRPSNTTVAGGIKYLEYPQNTQDIEKCIEIFKQLFLLVAGTFDLDQAQTKTNVMAYKAIAALLERAATMMRGKIRNYSKLVRERGRMYVSHLQNFYTEDRWITFREKDGTMATKQVKGTDFAGPVNLTVVTGSTLPVSRIQQREEALSLFTAGAIDQTEILEKLEWGDRNEVVRRMQAGPLGAIFDKLSQTGIPPELMQYIKSVAEADPKKIAAAMEKGEFPTFDKVMQEMIMANMPQAQEAVAAQQPPDPEAMKLEAETRKLEAAAALDSARAATEAVKQETMLAGITFDEDQMKLERAEAVHKMGENIKADAREEAKMANDITRGNHGEAREDKKLEIVSAQKNKPGFNDRKIRSDNKL